VTSSTVLVHAFVRGGAVSEGWSLSSPLGHRDCYRIGFGELDAIVSDVVEGEEDTLFADPEETQEIALRHHDLLCELMNDVDLVPVQLGTVYSSLHSLKEALLSQKSELLAGLQRCADSAEFTVRVIRSRHTTKEATPKPASGRDYLRSRQRRAVARRGDQDQLTDLNAMVSGRLGAVARGLVQDQPNREQGVVSAYTLLSDKDLPGATVQALEDLSTQLSLQGYQFEVKGPWPPYRFSQGVPS